MAIERRSDGSFRVSFSHPVTGWKPPARLPFKTEDAARNFDALIKLRRAQGRLGELWAEVYPADARRERREGLPLLGDFVLDEYWGHWCHTPGRGRSEPKAAKTVREQKRNVNTHVLEAIVERDAHGHPVRDNEGEPVVLDWGAEAIAWAPLDQLDPATVLAYARRLEAQRVGKETQRKILVFLAACYDHAVLLYPTLYGRPNPFRQVPKPSQTGTRKVRPLWPETVEQMRCEFLLIAELARARHDGRLSRAQAKKLRDLGWPVPETPYMAEFSAAACSALAYSSARPQELLALPQTAVDGQRLSITRHNENGQIKPGTKSTRYPSKRPLLIGCGAEDLHEWRLRLNAQMRELGVQTLLLFPREDGMPFDEQDYKRWRGRYFKPVAARLQFDQDAVEGPRPYQLRHLYGTLRVAAGHDMVAIERSMGTSLVAEVYADVREDYEEEGPIDIAAKIASARSAAPELAAADFREATKKAGLPELLVAELLASAALAA
jgi:hypothetical protein